MAMQMNVLEVSFRDQHGLVFSGPVKALSSKNSQGPFDLLPQHAHFISLITDEIRFFPISGGEKHFAIEQGVLRCFDNKVDIFTGLESQVVAKNHNQTPAK